MTAINSFQVSLPLCTGPENIRRLRIETRDVPLAIAATKSGQEICLFNKTKYH